MKLSANVSLLFAELPFLDRFAAAAQAGFEAVEAMYPYDQRIEDIASRLQAHALTLSVINLPPGDEKGLAVWPGRQTEFANSLSRGLDYALGLSCRRVHLLTGNLPPGAGLNDCRLLLLRNLERAVRHFAPHGITVLLEPLSRQALARYSLSRVEDAVSLIDELGSPDLRLQLDFYHTQMEQGNLAALIERYYGYIDYVQIAGVPGRHEPDVGEINYAYLLEALRQRGFAGWVGCEYAPRADTLTGLRWAREWGLLNK